MFDVFAIRNPKLRMYEDFFTGNDNQKMYLRKFEDESESEFDTRLDKSVIVNQCRTAVMKSARMLYAASKPLRRMEDEEAHKRMFRVWQYNKVNTGKFHLGIAIEVGI